MEAMAINRVCYLFSSFLPPINKIIVCIGMARVEDPILPDRVCRDSSRWPNPTGYSELRPVSISQSDLGSGDESCLQRLSIRTCGAVEIPVVAKPR